MTPNVRGIHREDYEPNKTYPILVKIINSGHHKIVEMEGWKVNEYNRMVRESNACDKRQYQG